MLAVDDLKKLAEMQARLLKMTSNDREANLEKYKDLVIQIDKYAFEDFLSELDQVNNHNQTLEEELQFLEQVRVTYQQLLEQQLGFKRVCELYGSNELQLSDLSLINIEYIDNRINIISGYLINRDNVEKSREKLELLNKELLTEEKNRQLLGKRLLEFESVLRSNFVNAEGRIIVDNELQYVSVVSEYKDLGYDFKQLLDDKKELEKLLSIVNDELFDVEEKLKAAEICYKSVSNIENEQILKDIRQENIRVKYKVLMLKILELLTLNYDDYVLFKKKREDLLSLIKYRLDCLNELGIYMSIDPFSRTKIVEQIELISSMGDNTENIYRIKKEITLLDGLLEQMVSKHNEYMIQLSVTDDLVKDGFKNEDIVIDSDNIEINKSYEEVETSNITINDILELDSDDHNDERIVLDNQVVKVEDLPMQFNMSIVSQKTSHVIKRVNEMFNPSSLVLDNDEEVVLAPELVIVQDNVQENSDDLVEDEYLVVNESDSVDSLFSNFSSDNVEFDEKVSELSVDNIKINDDVVSFEEENKLNESSNDNISVEVEEEIPVFEDNLVNAFDGVEEHVNNSVITIDENVNNVNSDIFVTVDPFVEAPLFSDRTDNDSEESVFFDSVDYDIEDQNIENINELVISDLKENIEEDSSIQDGIKVDELQEEMPDVFWVVDEDNKEEDINEEVVPSFDEQIDELLASDSSVKIKKLAA